jgi:hypothetical protein
MTKALLINFLMLAIVVGIIMYVIKKLTGKMDVVYMERLDWRMNVGVMVMTYFQNVSIFMSSGVEWPESIVVNFNVVGKFFDLDLVEMVAPECVLAMPHSVKFVLKLLVPLLILAYLDLIPRLAIREAHTRMGREISKSCIEVQSINSIHGWGGRSVRAASRWG